MLLLVAPLALHFKDDFSVYNLLTLLKGLGLGLSLGFIKGYMLQVTYYK
jgi:uncharacterized membrane protein (Fun14 family)